MKNTKRADFNAAVMRLLGDKAFNNMAMAGFSPGDFCREIAQRKFIGDLKPSEKMNDDLALIQSVATRLWTGDGVSGLED